jgi:predicted HTH transcriptional regulator
MEKIGTGIKRIKQFCKENNNDVEIKPTDTHFFVKMKTLDRPKDGVKFGVKVRGKSRCKVRGNKENEMPKVGSA